MASLGELTAGIAHEIQNPLNFVNNFAEVSTELAQELTEERARPTRDAELEAELLGDLKQNLHKITQHGQRAASIVRGMLEHSRASTGERMPTDLNALADEYLRLAYHGLRAKDKTFNATLKTEFAPQLPLVQAAGQDIGRVLLNLFTNAFYAVRQRQLAGEVGYAPTVRVGTQHVGDEVMVQVQDNGTGITEEGTVTILTFTMMKILVVDDEPDVRTLFEQRFRREIRSGALSFSFAFSGEEALDYLHEHHSEVVLILSDINMPGMSGLELLRRVRTEATPPPPPRVMMITAYG
nr:hypothetical protein [Tanacetum cinerariifolium]